MKYKNVYWSRNAMDDDIVTPDVLAIGDSWFWYPFPGGSLLNAIGDLISPNAHTIYAVGNNGAEAYDFVEGKYRHAAAEILRLYGSTANALLLSAGGNDFAGFNDLRPLLNDRCGNCTTAAECFRPGDEYTNGTVNWMMYRTFENYARLVSRALYVLPKGAKIFVHNYDYAVPTGKGLLGGAGWIKPALDDARVPGELQQPVVNFLIDAQTSVLDSLVASAPSRIVLVNSRGTLGAADWANELHPTAAGFAKIVDQCWRTRLQEERLA